MARSFSWVATLLTRVYDFLRCCVMQNHSKSQCFVRANSATTSGSARTANRHKRRRKERTLKAGKLKAMVVVAPKEIILTSTTKLILTRLARGKSIIMGVVPILVEVLPAPPQLVLHRLFVLEAPRSPPRSPGRMHGLPVKIWTHGFSTSER